MRILDMKPGETAYTQLSSYVLIVLSRRHDGWCAYIGAVAGDNHEREWPGVLASGDKLKPQVAEAIVKHYFYPGFDTEGVDYAL